MRRRIFLAAVAAFALLPATATAATLSVSNGTLTYAGGAGASDVDLSEPTGGTIHLARQSDDTDPITWGTGCTANGDGTFTCTGVSRISASLGDGNDVFELQGIGGGAEPVVQLPFAASGGNGDDIITGGSHGGARLDGGAGNDSLGASGGTNLFIGGPGDDELSGASDTDTYVGGPGIDEAFMFEPAFGDVAVSLDGRANDGEAGERDNVGADVEDVFVRMFELSPPSFHVTIVGNAADNELESPDEPSTIVGGAGNDVLTGGAFNDTIDARDGYADRVVCKGGVDTALVDTLDQVSATCERVQTTNVPNANEDRPPTVAWAGPRSGSTVRANRGVLLRAKASDDHGVVRVRFLGDGRLACQDTTAPSSAATARTAATSDGTR